MISKVTAIQLANLVSSMANGGKLLTPHIPESTKDDSKPSVRRQINIEPDSWQRMVPGMVGSVNYGSGKRAYDPLQTVVGKTGTCIQEGSWIGLFASYAPLVNPKLAVVVIARRSDGRGHFPAAVAGQIYRDLNHRFGTPTFMPIAQSPEADGKTDAKAAALNDEEKDVQEAEQKEAEAQDAAANDATTMSATDETTKASVNETKTGAAPSKVKPVIMPVPKRSEDTSKPASGSKGSRKAPAPDDRPRRVVGDQP